MPSLDDFTEILKLFDSEISEKFPSVKFVVTGGMALALQLQDLQVNDIDLRIYIENQVYSLFRKQIKDSMDEFIPRLNDILFDRDGRSLRDISQNYNKISKYSPHEDMLKISLKSKMRIPILPIIDIMFYKGNDYEDVKYGVTTIDNVGRTSMLSIDYMIDEKIKLLSQIFFHEGRDKDNPIYPLADGRGNMWHKLEKWGIHLKNLLIYVKHKIDNVESDDQQFKTVTEKRAYFTRLLPNFYRGELLLTILQNFLTDAEGPHRIFKTSILPLSDLDLRSAELKKMQDNNLVSNWIEHREISQHDIESQVRFGRPGAEYEEAIERIGEEDAAVAAVTPEEEPEEAPVTPVTPVETPEEAPEEAPVDPEPAPALFRKTGKMEKKEKKKKNNNKKKKSKGKGQGKIHEDFFRKKKEAQEAEDIKNDANELTRIRDNINKALDQGIYKRYMEHQLWTNSLLKGYYGDDIEKTTMKDKFISYAGGINQKADELSDITAMKHSWGKEHLEKHNRMLHCITSVEQNFKEKYKGIDFEDIMMIFDSINSIRGIINEIEATTREFNTSWAQTALSQDIIENERVTQEREAEAAAPAAAAAPAPAPAAAAPAAAAPAAPAPAAAALRQAVATWRSAAATEGPTDTEVLEFVLCLVQVDDPMRGGKISEKCLSIRELPFYRFYYTSLLGKKSITSLGEGTHGEVQDLIVSRTRKPWNRDNIISTYLISERSCSFVEPSLVVEEKDRSAHIIEIDATIYKLWDKIYSILKTCYYKIKLLMTETNLSQKDMGPFVALPFSEMHTFRDYPDYFFYILAHLLTFYEKYERIPMIQQETPSLQGLVCIRLNVHFLLFMSNLDMSMYTGPGRYIGKDYLLKCYEGVMNLYILPICLCYEKEKSRGKKIGGRTKRRTKKRRTKRHTKKRRTKKRRTKGRTKKRRTKKRTRR